MMRNLLFNGGHERFGIGSVLGKKAAKRGSGDCRRTAEGLLDEAARLWGDMLFTETETFLGPLIEDHGSAEMKTLLGNYKDYYNIMDLEGFLRGMHQRLIYQRGVREMFDDIDAYLMPTSLIRPFENDFDFKYPDQMPYILDAQKPLHLVNLLSLPSVALPTHLAGQTPLGVQLITAMHDDFFALDIAESLEREIGTLLG